MQESRNILNNFLISFLGFGVLFSFALYLLCHDVVKSLMLGIAGGLFFAMIIQAFIKKTRRELMKQAPEDCIYAISANHLTQSEARGGMLFLCKKEMIFQPHKMNFSAIPTAIAYTDIKMVQYGIVPRSICIVLNNAEQISFVVNHRKAVKQVIEKCYTFEESV